MRFRKTTTRRAHILLAGCALAVGVSCGRQPTAPRYDDEATPPDAAAQSDAGEFKRCARGTVEGLWIKDEGSEEHGRIEAAWINARGDTLGLVSGTFGFDTTAWAFRWEATVSGVHLTVVLFELAGTWTFTDPRLCPLCGTGQGAFTGIWRDPRTGHRGRVEGEWGDIFLPFAERKMPLTGKWTAACRPRSISVDLDRPS